MCHTCAVSCGDKVTKVFFPLCLPHQALISCRQIGFVRVDSDKFQLRSCSPAHTNGCSPSQQSHDAEQSRHSVPISDVLATKCEAIVVHNGSTRLLRYVVILRDRSYSSTASIPVAFGGKLS